MRDHTARLVGQIDALLALFPEDTSSWSSSNMGGGFKKIVEYERVITQSSPSVCIGRTADGMHRLLRSGQVAR
jgi:hypothetical protein